MEPINLASVGERFAVNDNYFIKFPPEPYLVITVGTKFGTAAYDFDHPNVIAKADKLLEFKHSAKNGRKLWTSHAGRDFAFVVNKLNITLIPEKGYSYVKIKIGDETIHLSVSGGTFPSGCWTDNVYQGAGVGVTSRLKLLKALAHAAMLPSEAKIHGVEFEFRDMSKGIAECWQADVAQRLTTLEVEDEIKLAEGWSIQGNKGPFPIVAKRKRAKSVIIAAPDDRQAKATYQMIDWFDAAERKGIFIPTPHISAKLHKMAPEQVTA